MDLNRANVELHIGTLNLGGIDAPGDRVAASLRMHLGELIAERGLPNGFEEALILDSLDGGQLEIDPFASPESIGASLAETVYGRLSP